MNKHRIRVEAKVIIPTPAVAFPLHAKGKHAHLRSEEFARRKQEEIDLEDRGRGLGNG